LYRRFTAARSEIDVCLLQPVTGITGFVGLWFTFDLDKTIIRAAVFQNAT